MAHKTQILTTKYIKSTLFFTIMEAAAEQKSANIKQKILGLIKIKGPIIPAQIYKEINSDILMSSAHLSELSSEGKVKVSNIKIGGTPLYYLHGQEPQLQNFSDNLHEKERKAYEILKEKKILRDSKLEPVIRVALREIKDFAVPLQVTYQNNKEIFWKWYLLSKGEAESLIKPMLTKKEEPKPIETKKPEPKKEIKPEPKEPIKKEIKERPLRADTTSSFLQELKSYFNRNKINIKNEQIIRKNSEIDFILEIPSTIGSLEFYCKAKNKKRVNDSDLSSAYVQGQLKKLPVLFLTKGDLTKKAKEILNTEFKLEIKKI